MIDKAIENVAAAYGRTSNGDETLLIVVDTGVDATVQEILARAAERSGRRHDLISSAPAPAPNAEPVPEVADALREHDLNVLATSVPIAHTAAVRDAVAAGRRVLVMDGITPEALGGGAASADYNKMHEVGLAIEERWNNARHVRVTSEHGMDFVADVTGRESWRWDGWTFRADWFQLTGCAFPDGEVGIAPLEDSGQGTIVWDASVHGVGLLEEPIRLEVRDGWIERISGGAQAAEFERMLESQDDKNSYYVPAEIAIGINDAATVTGAMREDKKVRGTVHIACGTNVDLGGTIHAKLHIDGLIRRPSLWLDDAPIVLEGAIVDHVLP
jgi:2,5-dihydroxypyridine 5,6-dioxygenase